MPTCTEQASSQALWKYTWSWSDDEAADDAVVDGKEAEAGRVSDSGRGSCRVGARACVAARHESAAGAQACDASIDGTPGGDGGGSADGRGHDGRASPQMAGNELNLEPSCAHGSLGRDVEVLPAPATSDRDAGAAQQALTRTSSLDVEARKGEGGGGGGVRHDSKDQKARTVEAAATSRTLLCAAEALLQVPLRQ